MEDKSFTLTSLCDPKLEGSGQPEVMYECTG